MRLTHGNLSRCGGRGANALSTGAGERLDLAADAGWGVARIFSVARVDGDEVGVSLLCHKLFDVCLHAVVPFFLIR